MNSISIKGANHEKLDDAFFISPLFQFLFFESSKHGEGATEGGVARITPVRALAQGNAPFQAHDRGKTRAHGDQCHRHRGELQVRV